MRSPRLRGIYVPLPDPAARRALVNMAEREQRDPRQQAARFILDGLRAAGALPIEVTDYRDVTPASTGSPADHDLPAESERAELANSAR
jgi:hypothetical protein